MPHRLKGRIGSTLATVDPDVIDRSVTLEGVDWSLVGVMPPRFAFPHAQT